MIKELGLAALVASLYSCKSVTYKPSFQVENYQINKEKLLSDLNLILSNIEYCNNYSVDPESFTCEHTYAIEQYNERARQMIRVGTVTQEFTVKYSNIESVVAESDLIGLGFGSVKITFKKGYGASAITIDTYGPSSKEEVLESFRLACRNLEEAKKLANILELLRQLTNQKLLKNVR